MLRHRSFSLLPLALTLAAAVFPAPACAGPFSDLVGSWSGSGQIQSVRGHSKELHCTAHYAEEFDGNGLTIAMRCTSGATHLDLRATLMAEGYRLSGDWEERHLEASGQADGSITDNVLLFNLHSGDLSGAVGVTTNGSRQGVWIATGIPAMKTIQLGLVRY
jgi:hypothetical protein